MITVLFAYDLLLVFYRDFVPVFQIFDFKNYVTLENGYGSVKVIVDVAVRENAYDFLLTFYSNYGSISCRF